ncbi:hypothetical protein B0H15DRAFT_245214 [Mycena belliarum]|uniref:Uncharacterized protein n=1 Tax=Mycena belliarum TaxID=1033014 RepID=A0AAD6U648_9AGAR|nr:hypothetical protein B0H15DRAFT_245214 [Mycena belliae]
MKLEDDSEPCTTDTGIKTDPLAVAHSLGPNSDVPDSKSEKVPKHEQPQPTMVDSKKEVKNEDSVSSQSGLFPLNPEPKEEVGKLTLQLIVGDNSNLKEAVGVLKSDPTTPNIGANDSVKEMALEVLKVDPAPPFIKSEQDAVLLRDACPPETKLKHEDIKINPSELPSIEGVILDAARTNPTTKSATGVATEPQVEDQESDTKDVPTTGVPALSTAQDIQMDPYESGSQPLEVHTPPNRAPQSKNHL